MFIKALIAFIALPGVFAYFLPPVIAHVDPWSDSLPIPGIIIICLGSAVVLRCVRDFYVSGKGTLAPWEPPKELIITGLYQYVRNPMYIGVVIVVMGWSMYFRSFLILAYGMLLALSFHIRVVKYEEPRLHQQFGKKWELYRDKVNRWLPKFII